MASSKHTQPIKNAAFSGIQSVRIANQAVGATLTAYLNVLSFTGGVSPSLRLMLNSVDDSGNVLDKINGGLGTIILPGLHVLIFGPGGNASAIGDDKNNGALPARFDLRVDDSAGDQTSADIALEVIIS